MKKFFIFCMTLFTAMFTYAQNEPEFEFEPHLYSYETKTMGEILPCENAYIKAKAGASMYLVGIGKAKSYCYLGGVESNLKINNSQWIIVNTGGKSPLQCISINKMEQLKSKRRFKVGEVGSFTGATTGDDSSLPFKYKKLEGGNGSVLISLADLEKGEYCLSFTNQQSNSKSMKVYTFCIQ